MKKLSFIIPKVKFISFILIVISILAPKTINGAENGCRVLVGSSYRLFYNSYGSEWITTGTVDLSGATGGYREDGSMTYGCIAVTGGSCTVYQQYINPGPPSFVDIREYRNGLLANVDPVNCPIDDYIPLLFIFTLGIATFYIKRVPTSINEGKHHHGSL